MKLQIDDIGTCKKRMNVEIPREMYNKERELAINSLRNKVAIKGFRKGKVPKNIVETYYSNDIEQDTLKKIIFDTYQKVFSEQKINVLGQPVLEDIKNDKEGPLSFTATLDFIPNIEISDYKKFSFIKKKKAINDEACEAELARLREAFAEFEVSEDASIAHSDYVITDIEPLTFNEIPSLFKKNYPVLIGSNMIAKEIEEGIIGLKKEASKDITVKFPDDYKDRDSAGKEILFKVTVKEIKKKKLKELDDNFAKDVGYQDMAEFRTKTMERLAHREEISANNVIEGALIDKLVEAHTFDVPEALIEEQLKLMAEETKRRSYMLGGSFDYNTFKDNKDNRASAVNIVKGSLLLDKIAEIERIELTQTEIEDKISELAVQYNVTIDELKRRIQKNDYYAEQLVSHIKREKTIDRIISMSKVEEEVVLE